MEKVQLMFLVLLLLIAWIPAVIGWGIISLVFRSQFSITNFHKYEITEVIIGFAVLSILAGIINLFAPLTTLVNLTVLFVGWLLFIVRCRWIAAEQIKLSHIISSVIWLIIVAFAASQSSRVGDTGLYHTQSIKWMNENPTPLGLANLHGRFGFNSAWLSIAAILQLPPKDEGIFIINALLMWFYGITVYGRLAATLRNRKWLLGDTFLLLTPIASQGFYVYSYVSSASPDLAVIILTFLSVFMALKALDHEIEMSYAIWATLFTAAFAITIKISSAALLFIPMSMLFLTAYRRIQLVKKPLLRLSYWCAIIIMIPWMARNFLLSGCLVYPVEFTCVPLVSWTVSSAQVEYETAFIRSWARAPGLINEPIVGNWARSAFDPTLGNRNWFLPWLKATFKSKDIIAILCITTAGLFLLLLPITEKQYFYYHPIWLIAPLLSGVVFWLLTAPDRRFGAGYLWSISLYVITMGIVRLHNSYLAGILGRICQFLSTTMVVVSVGSCLAIISVYSTMCAISQYFEQSELFGRFKESPPDDVESYRTSYGNLIYKPRLTGQCKSSPLPCTPYFYEALKISKRPNGRLIMQFPSSGTGHN